MRTFTGDGGPEADVPRVRATRSRWRRPDGAPTRATSFVGVGCSSTTRPGSGTCSRCRRPGRTRSRSTRVTSRPARLTFLLAPVADNTGTTAIGTPTTVATTTIGENAERTFAGTAGPAADVRGVGQHVQRRRRPVRCADPDDVVVGVAVRRPAPTGFRDVFTLPATGTYTIIDRPRDQQTGSLTFLLAEAPAGLAAAARRAEPSTARRSADASTRLDRRARRARRRVRAAARGRRSRR